MPDIDDNRKQPTQELVRGSATRRQRLDTVDIGVWLIGTNGWSRWDVSTLMVAAQARAAKLIWELQWLPGPAVRCLTLPRL
jgi:hypothetical protein